MMITDNIKSSSEVRNQWSAVLNDVERGCAVTIVRNHHKPATMVDREHYINMLQKLEELSELVEVYELLADPEISAGVEEADAEIERGEGLSFEEAFGTAL